MAKIETNSICNGCQVCANVCPKSAISMVDNEKGFKYPVIDKEKCVDCGLCDKKCPVLNKKDAPQNTPLAYACYNNNEEIRAKSSSGGVFTLLAEYIIENGGVVVGAAFDESFLVRHIIVDNKEDLAKLRTSKYLQSDVGFVYKETKALLNEGKTVLFTGTPCQVNGLLTYLGRDYDNLFTQDIVCHGVPSPKVWNKYLEYRKAKDNADPVYINFREKIRGWNNYSVNIKYENGSYEGSPANDLYMQAFLRDASLRESCYSCSFKSKSRAVDITLADFWGVEGVVPQLNDNKGISLVIVHSEKGKTLIDKIADKMFSMEVDFEKSVAPNPSMYHASAKPKNADLFFENLDKLDFEELVKKYTVVKKPSLSNRLIGICKRIVKKLLGR